MKKFLQIYLGFSFFLNSILFAQPIIISVTATSVDCNGNATGTISFEITGGTKPYYYYLIKGGETQSSPQTNDTIYTFENLSAGIYLCIVEDKNSLNDFRNRTITQPPPIKINSVNQVPITCSGYANGKLDITASGESGTYSFFLSPVGLSNNTGSFDMLAPGSYRVIVSDATGCQTKDSTDIIVFNDPLPITITNVNSSNLTCNGSGDGVINVSATGGTGALTYTLNPGSISNTTGTFSNLTKGTYTIEVSDINDCPSVISSPITLSEPLPLQFTSQNKTNATCSGVDDGTINVTVSGGTAPYVFTLNPGGITNSTGNFTGLAPGTYTVSFTDANSCGPVISNSFVISSPDPINITSVTSSNITCNNLNDGIIQITASGGNAPLTYTLNPGGISQPTGNFTGLANGTYIVTVSDTEGCAPAATSPITIINPPEIIITEQTVNQISCYGAANGSIIIKAQGGTGTLNYTLNPGAVTKTDGNFTGLGPGTYTVSVTDINNCPSAVSGPFTLNEPSPLQFTSQNKTNATCSGVDDGTINVTVSGGTAPYVFTLNPGGITNSTGNFTGLAPGTYTVSFNDANSCGPVISNNFVISSPDPISITSVTSSNITCNNLNDGIIQITASGGNAPLTYTLNPGGISQPTGNFTGLANGTYIVTVSDTEGCAPAATSPITIINPPEIIITEQTVNQISCYGAANGSIIIKAQGGTGTLNYTLNPGAVTKTDGNFTGLGPGTYTVSVTDINNCPSAVSGPFTLNEPSPLQFTSQNKTNATCSGVDDGTINVTVSGGTAPYVFTLNPGGITNSTGNFTGLAPGTYTVSFNDANSCGPVISNNFVISSPDPISITSVTSSNITCNNLNDGIIQITASGGNAPLTYTLNPGGISQPTGNFTGLANGTYIVTVSDTEGCAPAATSPITIINPPEIIITEQTVNQISCYGAANGSIIIKAQGGTGTLNYTLNPGAVTKTDGNFTGLGPGTYTVSVTDINNCPQASSGPIQIIEPAVLSASLESSSIINLDCSGDNNGVININVSGGTEPYSYSWTGPNGFTASSKNISSLLAGSYNLTVTDAKSCVTSYTPFVTISEPTEIQISFSKTDVTCKGDADGSVTINASGGTPGYQYSIDGINYQSSNLFTGLPGNTYTIFVKDNKACVSSNTITINEPAELNISNETKTDGNLCYGDSNGEIRIEGVTGGNSPYEYSINGGLSYSTNSVFNNLPAGTYQTVVKDSKGCLVNGNENIILQPQPIQINNYTQVNITGCYGNSNGQINIQASGGTGAKQYRINGGPLNSSGNFTGLEAGDFLIEITDVNNCKKDTVVTLTQPPIIQILSLSKSNVTGCAGNTNGSINVTATGGTGTLQYMLNSGPYQLSGNFTDLKADNYTLTIKDESNCLKDTVFQITEPTPISAIITTTLYINEHYKGSISISNATGGTGSYQYSIYGMAGPFTSQTTYTNLNSGNYTVVVRDQNYCTYTQIVEVSALPPLNVVVTHTDPTCNGSNDGKIRMNVTDPSGAIEYSIDDSVTWHSNNEFINLSAGTYKIAVREESGRYFSTVITLQDPASINVNSNVSPATCNAFSTDGSVTITATGGTGNKTFKWSDGPTTKDRVNISSGTYILTTTDENGCQVNSTIFIPANIYVFANAGTDTTVCEGSTITLNGQGGGSTYFWSPAEGLSNPNIANPSALINRNSTFVLTVTGANNCYNKDTVQIDIFPKLGLFAGNDTAILLNNSVNLNATGGPFVTYLWVPSTGLSDPSIPNPTATLRTSQTYVLSAFDQHGCMETDTINISIIEPILIYNSFSPNGDGINDYWDIDNAEYYPDIVVEVYNRWGAKIFSSKGYTSEKRWNGYYKGTKVPIGTYYYVVIPYIGAKPLTGPLTILR